MPTIAGDTKERAKPGPKANPGGINEKLRALDRSGKPTRRWKKVQYPVNTCAGYVLYDDVGCSWCVSYNSGGETDVFSSGG